LGLHWDARSSYPIAAAIFSVHALALETLPTKRAGVFYEEATRGRNASHQLEVKAALSLL
jgi:hypothetical protein